MIKTETSIAVKAESLLYLSQGLESGVLWELLRRYKLTLGGRLVHTLQRPAAPAEPAHEWGPAPNTESRGSGNKV